MSSKTRGAIMAWVQGATTKSAFQERTTHLIRILRSPSKMEQVMHNMHEDDCSDSDDDSDAESHPRSNGEKTPTKMNFVSSKLMKMSPQIREVIQFWLHGTTTSPCFRVARTARLIPVLRSPSMTAELMTCLRTPSTDLYGESTQTPDESPTEMPDEWTTQTLGETPTQTPDESPTQTPDESQLLIKYLEKLLHPADKPESPTQTSDSEPTENPAESSNTSLAIVGAGCLILSLFAMYRYKKILSF